MGHSFVIGREQELQVRDSTFEFILERLLVMLEQISDTKTAGLVHDWYEEWVLMPPGCKEVDIRGLSHDTNRTLRQVIAELTQQATLKAETRETCQKFAQLLSSS